MFGVKPLTEVIRLELPDRAGPYRWKPEALQEHGVRLVRLLHNGFTQPRKRKDVESVQEGAWPYRLAKGEIIWSCYEWLAPKTHKLKIEVDRTVQVVGRLVDWLGEHPEALDADDLVEAITEGCDDGLVRKLAADPAFEVGTTLMRLLAGSR